MAEFMIEILADTLLDLTRIVPFLIVIYLFLEWMENQAGHSMERFLERHRRLNPLAGTLFGLLPTCGFATAASSLYATGVISAGTLVAIFLSSSDEMLSIMLGMQADLSKIAPVLGVKLVVGIVAGYGFDALSRHRSINVNEFCQREHDDHSHGILYSACMHTLQVSMWLFVTVFVFNGIVELIGEEVISGFITSHPSQSVLFCGLVGLIPSCASSIILTTMYIDNVIAFSAVCAGLLVNAGTGMIMLYRVNPDWKENTKILVATFVCGIAAGFILQILGF
ncbi:MAG: putative manganese transporter [Bulleidia sp.]